MLEMLQSALGDCLGLLDEKKVLEVARNSDQSIWVNRLGEGWQEAGICMAEQDALRIIKYAASYKGAVCDAKQSIVSCVLPFNGSRFQGIVPPVVRNATFTIRKKALLVFTLDDYVQQGILSEKDKETILKAVHDRLNIVVVGGAGTGKTTFCNAVLDEIAKCGQRVVILEDTEELQCNAPNCVSQVSNDYVKMRDLLKGTMRLSPDRIIIGEVRDGAALDLLKAWNTGHPGGCATIHANSAVEGLYRLEEMVSEVSQTPQNGLISRAVDMLVYMELVNNRRIVKEIVRVKGYKRRRIHSNGLLDVAPSIPGSWWHKR